MALADFLKDRETKHEQNQHTDKDVFRQKCHDMLERIKNINPDKYTNLNKIYHAKFSGPNVPKKYIMGFYGTLMQEIKNLTTIKEVIHFPSKTEKPKHKPENKKVTAPKKAAAKKPAVKTAVKKKVVAKTKKK